MDKSSLSVSDISEELKISENTVYYWLRGDTKPSIGNMRNLADLMEIRAFELRKAWHEWEDLSSKGGE